MVSPRIAVVGAGLAGLAAALDLRDAGCAVDLYERSRLIGGRATSFEIDGHEVDNGQHVFLACCSAFRGFVERVGMARHLRIQPRFEARVFARDGTSSTLRAAPLPAPLHVLASFARYRPLSPRARLSVARALAAARRPASTPGGTFGQWLAEHGQSAAALRAFWEPFFVPAFNAPLDRVAAEEALFVVRTAFLQDAGAARFGFSTVPLARVAQAAAERTERVRLSTAVLRVDPPDAASQYVRLHLAGGERAEYDAAILAVTPPRLARMLGEPARYGLADLERFEAFPIVDVHLRHDGGALGFDFAALLDSPVQWLFEKTPEYACASMSAAHAYLTMSTDELIRTCWSEVTARIPALRDARLTGAAVTRNPEATYLPPPGLARPAQGGAAPRVAIAGSWTQTGWPDTMEAAVRSGYAAAAAVLKDLDRKKGASVA